jgi:hypothetical protein
MNDQANPVDAGSDTTATEKPEPATKDAHYWRNEMHNAVQSRQAAKEELRAAKAQLAELKAQLGDKPKADANGSAELSAKIIAELTASNEALATKLETQTKTYREGAILSRLTAGIPDDRHEAIATLYRANAATLDDGTAEIAAVAEKAGELLKAKAAPLFTTIAEPTKGRLPNPGGSPEFNADAERAKTREALRKAGGTGVTL